VLPQETSEAIVELPLLPKPHLKFRRVHIHIHVTWGHSEKEKSHGMAIAGQQRPIGLVERMTQGAVLHWSIIHKKALLASGRTVEGGPGNEPMDLQALIGMLYCQQMLLQPLAKYHLNALP
jgi:hypothetical protein